MKIEIPGFSVKVGVKKIVFNKDHVDLYYSDGSTQMYQSDIMYSIIEEE